MSRTENLALKHKFKDMGFNNSVFMLKLTCTEFNTFLEEINESINQEIGNLNSYAKNHLIIVTLQDKEIFYIKEYESFKKSKILLNKVLDGKNRLH